MRYSVTRIGKEIIVDPTDSAEDYTAEMLNGTSTLEYCDPADKVDILRKWACDQVKTHGLRVVAREIGYSPGHLQEFIDGKLTPRASTLINVNTGRKLTQFPIGSPV